MSPDCVWTSEASSETQETFSAFDKYGGSENKTVRKHSEPKVRICQIIVSIVVLILLHPWAGGMKFSHGGVRFLRDHSMSGLMERK